ncbi:hypothetical protein Leryth_005837 [Lithospermum erythrorhizon]|nr:hypothetical protein Leryth_005837 [Lithospermum erythrorhizon]
MRIYVFFLVLAIVVPKINGSNINTQRKLEEATPDDLSNKCGGCPCNSPCVQVPPPSPPSPPPPSPPPPAPKPPSINCPPPPPPPTCSSCNNNPSVPTPPSQPIYLTGPPGNLYPVDAYYNKAGQEYSVGLPLLIGYILQGLLVLL